MASSAADVTEIVRRQTGRIAQAETLSQQLMLAVEGSRALVARLNLRWNETEENETEENETMELDTEERRAA